MFSNVSWQTYWTFVVLVTVAYYVIVYLVCFRKAYPLSFQKQAQEFIPQTEDKSQTNLFPSSTQQLQTPPVVIDGPIAYACMDELNAFFENQKNTRPVRSELMFGLYTIVQKYPSLRTSGYKDSLMNVIATQCENICSIHLSAEELNGVWFGE